MKVLLSAFACRPDIGSEPEVGFQTLMAAAKRHQVWLLTSDYYMAMLKERLATSSFGPNVELVPTGWRISDEDMHQQGVAGFHWRYDRWQKRVAPVAVMLDRKVNFDVVHHATLATYWGRAGVAAVPKPFVWGPVGGATVPPLPLITELGWRGIGPDVVRALNRSVLERRRTIRKTIREASVVLAQNDSTLRRLKSAQDARVLPNGLCVDIGNVEPPYSGSRDVIFAGRLLAWKGVTLAVRTFRYVKHPEARLLVFGAGPAEDRLRRLIQRWDLQDRVELRGKIPRAALLDRIAGAGALLHPSLHDEGGTAVAEALSLGTPVVCLAHGGPEQLLRWWPGTSSVAVTPGSPATTARRLATALDALLSREEPGQHTPPITAYADAMEAIYQQVAHDACAED